VVLVASRQALSVRVVLLAIEGKFYHTFAAHWIVEQRPKETPRCAGEFPFRIAKLRQSTATEIKHGNQKSWHAEFC
jgi:hypothetical protein